MAAMNRPGDRSKPTTGRTLRSEVMVRQIEEDIVGGKLAPGAHLGTKAELRERFRLAAATINEAVRMLEMRGLVEARPGPGGGLFVKAANPVVRLQHVTLSLRQAAAATVDKAVVIRRALEAPICIDAAQFHTKSQLRSLRRFLKELDASKSSEDYMRTVWLLHREIAAISPNDMLREIYFGLLDVLETNIVSADIDGDVLEKRNKDHHELVEAIASRDLVLVEDAVAKHNLPV